MLMFMGLLLAPLASSSSEDSVSADDVLEELLATFFESSEISLIKNGTVKACPYATLSEMAAAFFKNPRWIDFHSVRVAQW